MKSNVDCCFARPTQSQENCYPSLMSESDPVAAEIHGFLQKAQHAQEVVHEFA